MGGICSSLGGGGSGSRGRNGGAPPRGQIRVQPAPKIVPSHRPGRVVTVQSRVFEGLFQVQGLGKAGSLLSLASTGTQTKEYHCTEILPCEVWDKILEKCEHNALLNCRAVCKTFEALSERILMKPSLWRDDFTNFKDFLSGVRGTRLGTFKQTYDFITRMKTHQGNPFPNGTLIFAPYITCIQDDICEFINSDKMALQKFYNSFGDIVNLFGKYVLKLVFVFNHEDNGDELLKHVAYICSLQNLKTLAVYRAHGVMQNWVVSTNDHSNSILSKRIHFLRDKAIKARVLARPEQLLLFGTEVPAHIPLFAILLMPAFLSSVSHLQISWNDSLGMVIPKGSLHLPKLKYLKITNPHQSLIDYLCIPSVNAKTFPCALKEIRILITATFSTFMLDNMLTDFMAILDRYHSKSLELIYLDFPDTAYLATKMEYIARKEEKNPLLFKSFQFDEQIKYPKLKKLYLRDIAVWYCTGSWKAMKKFNNLETITLLKGGHFFPPDFVMHELWEYLPSVKEIQLFRGGRLLKLKRGQNDKKYLFSFQRRLSI